MDYGIKDSIVAVVTTNKNVMGTPNSPVFFVNNEAEMDRTALLIAKTTGGMVHEIQGGTYIIVRH